MVFGCDGITYDTADMTAYYTGMSFMPTIFLTQDGRSVFVLTLDRWQGANVHQAGAEEVKSLAERFGITPLLRSVS